jgi:multimeric flavodoxin WrbA
MTATHTPPRVLGLSAGADGGSAEILLAVALDAARTAGADVQLVSLLDLRLQDDGDLSWLWDRLVECDGLIVSTPIMSRTVAARLKLLVDGLLGPNADAAIVEHLVALRRAGTEPAVPFRVDERVLRPRVAGFLAVGGSLTPQWKALALPLMHTVTFSMHIAVVDQAVFGGAGTPRSVLLDEAALDRAARLGGNVASQLGKAFEDADYLGPPGLCPMCHLDVIELTGTAVTCATCGCRGEIRADLSVRWTDRTTSVLSMAEKRSHAAEIQETAARHRALQDVLSERAGRVPVVARVTPTRAPSASGTAAVTAG